ncbi:MAG: HAD hydrolase-like protein [Christensenellales bacterium]
MYRSIFFDVDGTLFDPCGGMTEAYAYAIRNIGLPEMKPQELEDFVGPPFALMMGKKFGLCHEDCIRSRDMYREHFGKYGIYKARPYEHVEDMLTQLKARGAKLYLGTSKPQVYVEQLLNRFDFRKYFDGIGAASFDDKKTKKADVIRSAIQDFSIDPRTAIMVGDRQVDVEGARENGIPCVAVRYGFAPPGELESCGPVDIVDTVEDLAQYLLARLVK